jgi:predicted TPR repeat methyltransferase
MLATASGDAPSRCADAYVEIAFDAYAERFDDHIRSLDYRGPGLIAGAMAAAYGAPAGTLDIVDLGCGTGLCAPALRPYARRLDGVDLSEAMLERARALGLYDSLAHGELTAFVEGLPPRSCDVAASGDTLCYFGDLAPVFTAAAAALRPGGRLIATLEATSSSAPRELGPSGRYRHGEAFARAEAERAGLTVETVRAEKLRDEGGGPVAGWLLALRRG